MSDNTNAFAAQLARFHNALHRWYEKEGRCGLPWRNTADPYAIYLSEVMLQQTQVKTVLDRYYKPFLERFPTLDALAAAPLEEVIKQWEGLGYYSRAANLHKAAQQSGGSLPASVERLMALPGIGRNTASAVAAFAFGVAVPVMEANVKRVLCRVFAMAKPSDAELWLKAGQLLDKTRPFDYNQAMMDVGSLICTKRAPQCPRCPLNSICKGRVTPEAYPAPKTARQIPVRRRVIVAFIDEAGRYSLTRRDTRFLHGMYGFAELPENTAELSFGDRHFRLGAAEYAGQFTQAYSHFVLDAKVYRMRVTSGGTRGASTWAALEDISRYPLSRADIKIVQLLKLMPDAEPAVASGRCGKIKQISDSTI